MLFENTNLICAGIKIYGAQYHVKVYYRLSYKLQDDVSLLVLSNPCSAYLVRFRFYLCMSRSKDTLMSIVLKLGTFYTRIITIIVVAACLQAWPENIDLPRFLKGSTV